MDWLAIDDSERIAALSRETVAVCARTAAMLRKRWLHPVIRIAEGAETLRKGLENVDAFERLAHRQAAGEDPIFYHAPVVLVTHVPRADYFGRDHAAYAAYNLMLGAQRQGLCTCQIGYLQLALDRDKSLRDSLGLTRDRQAEIALALGYPAYSFHRAPTRRQPELHWNVAP